MKLRILAVVALLFVLAGATYKAEHLSPNTGVTCCDPPPQCAPSKCPPVGK